MKCTEKQQHQHFIQLPRMCSFEKKKMLDDLHTDGAMDQIVADFIGDRFHTLSIFYNSHEERN